MNITEHFYRIYCQAKSIVFYSLLQILDSCGCLDLFIPKEISSAQTEDKQSLLSISRREINYSVGNGQFAQISTWKPSFFSLI